MRWKIKNNHCELNKSENMIKINYLFSNIKRIFWNKHSQT